MSLPADVTVAPSDPHDPVLLRLLDTLTADLAQGEYTAAQTFGYSRDQLVEHDVHLIGARSSGVLIGVGGLERTDGFGEPKLRFYRRRGFVDIDRFGPYVDSATSVCLQCSLVA